MASSLAMPTKEQAQEFALATWEGTKSNFFFLKEAGLFKFEHVLAFSGALKMPFEPENFNVPTIQATLLARTDDLIRGFTIMNGLAFLLEVLGDLTALLLGRALPLFIFNVVYAFMVAYGLYWLVVHPSGNDFKLVAIGLYVIYSMINIVQCVVTFALVIPPLFYIGKTVASLCCAYYAFKIEKLSAAGGFSQLKEDGVELGVAE